jgi:pimeloyl-ACP methyl ester carboxylesterase
VCSYDRAGLGFSDAAPEIGDSESTARRLHRLLELSHVPRPYVMVGQSLGGFHVRVFRDLYPSEVVGLVLVDSSHPDQRARLPQELLVRSNELGARFWWTWLGSYVGLDRLLGQCPGADPRMGELGPLVEPTQCGPRAWAHALPAHDAFEVSAAQAKIVQPLGSLPLAVLTHDPRGRPGGADAELFAKADEVWPALQNELAQLSTHATHEVVEGAGHDIHLDVPDPVIRAIQQVSGLNPPPWRSVIVADHDLRPGDAVTEDDMAMRSLDVDDLGGPDALGADDVKAISGKRLRAAVARGRPFLRSALEPTP